MQDNQLGVTIVPPLRGEGWISIDRYVEAITTFAPGARLHISTVSPIGASTLGRIEAYRVRYRELPGHVAAHVNGSGLVHIADQALGHVVPALQGPTVVTCHDLMPIAAEGHYSSAFEGWFDRTLLNVSLQGMTEATRVIAVSETTANEVVRLLQIPRERISVVPNVVAPELSRVAGADAWLEARGIQLPAGPRILSVGHTRPYKNVDTLLRALATPQLRNVSLVRCGALLTDAQQALVADLGLTGRVLELGHRQADELRAVYSACDVLAQPSRAEGFGVPVVEAMACSLPVVCSDAAALKEVAGNAARVVAITGLPDQDAADLLAKGLEEVLTDSTTAARLRGDGLRRAREFAPARVIPKLMAAYERTVAEFNS